MVDNFDSINKKALVTASQMQEIEAQIFASGMPVASLMEKVALKTTCEIFKKLSSPQNKYLTIGVLVGCGHNGGDALVIARELYSKGYNVLIYSPLAHKSKDLTKQHLLYAQNIGIPVVKSISDFQQSDLIIDGLFGFGLTREITGDLADQIRLINQWHRKVISVDIPSGIHTDTGEVLGIAIKANLTLCLGLYKTGLFQDRALDYVGKVKRIDFDIPPRYIEEVIKKSPTVELINGKKAKKVLPLPRHVTSHKYKQGHLLLICGSKKYAGAALLSAYGARCSGVGMVSIAVPESLKYMVNSHIPEGLVIGCEETDGGAIESLPSLDWGKFDWVSCGMGLTRDAVSVVEMVINSGCNILLDADGLNITAEHFLMDALKFREGQTVLTPHDGEFQRLFPDLINVDDRIEGNRLGAIALSSSSSKVASVTILRKGAKSIISNQEHSYIIPETTPALARGGSGDVLSGFIAGLLAQSSLNRASTIDIVATAAWIHQQAAILAQKEVSQMGVDGVTLSKYILKFIAKF